MTRIEAILDLARWAPSGDNSQPWRFEIVSDTHVVVHGFDTRRDCIYDRDGRASQLAIGAMLETLRIAATAHGLSSHVERRRESPETAPVFDVLLAPADIAPDPLGAVIRERSVQRRPLRTRALDEAEKRSLESAAGPDYAVRWFESWRDRARIAWLAARNAKIRLTIPEAYAVHREIIEWDAQFSESRVPDQALGSDALTTRSMRWAMASWERIEFMNRYLGGTLAPRLQLDLIPGLLCAAHFALVAAKPPREIDDYASAGAAVQRFWLTATRLGLQLQPQYTPLVFAAYANAQQAFTAVAAARTRAEQIARELDRLLGTQGAAATVFLGRIGAGPAARARSLRLPLESLRWSESAQKP